MYHTVQEVTMSRNNRLTADDRICLGKAISTPRLVTATVTHSTPRQFSLHTSSTANLTSRQTKQTQCHMYWSSVRQTHRELLSLKELQDIFLGALVGEVAEVDCVRGFAGKPSRVDVGL